MHTFWNGTVYQGPCVDVCQYLFMLVGREASVAVRSGSLRPHVAPVEVVGPRYLLVEPFLFGALMDYIKYFVGVTMLLPS